MALIGLGTASGPLAAKAAADTEIMRLTGASISAGSMGFGGLGPPSPGSTDDYATNVIKASDYIRLMGVPNALDAQLRDNACWVDRLDPDIAIKRSWSMAVKFATQRQRNYDRALARMRQAGDHQRGRSALKALLGFEWPLGSVSV